LKIETTPRDDHQVTMIVEAEAEQMEAAKRRAARKIASTGKIPGFRPGKAPYDVIVRYYGEAAITEQAIEFLVDDVYPKALDEAGVKPAAAGQLENVEKLDPPTFKFTVPLEPSVDLGDYKSVRHAYEFVSPGAEKLEESLDELRRMYAQTETIERPIQDGDFVLVSYVGKKAKAAADDAALLEDEAFAVFIRTEAKEDEEPFPGFAAKLIGMKADDETEFSHKFAKDHSNEAVAGQTVKFAVKVKMARGMTLPELNDEFAKMVGAGETMDELREKLQKSIEQRAQDEYDDAYYVELIEKIKDGATIKYAKQTLDHEIEHVLEDLRRRLSQQGMEFETYLKMREMTLEEFVEAEVREVAQKRLERSLVMDQLSQAEKLEISEEALQAEFQQSWATLAATDQEFARQTKGGTRPKKQMIDAVAMDAANRLMTRNVLERIKAIATGAAGEEEAPAKKKAPKKKAAEAEQATEDAPVAEEAPKKRKSSKKSEEKSAE
jgi:trigger factor